MKDPLGAVLTLIRDDPAVAALVSGRVSVLVETPPSVQILPGPTTRRPFGVGSGRVGTQLWTGFAKCWGADSVAGAIASRQLAGAVSDALHNRGAYRGSTFLLRTYAPDIEGMERDPDTRRPFHLVRIEAHAATEAVA